MRKKLLKKLIIEETAAASVVEYTIVLPLCLFVILFIFMVGYALNQRAVLDAAANRGVLIAQQYYSDPKYSSIVTYDYSDDTDDYIGYYERNEIGTTGFNNDPYRFLFSKSMKNEIVNIIEERTRFIIKKNQLIQLDNRLTEVETEVSINGAIFKTAEVVVKQRFYFPKILKIIGIDPEYEMVSKASIAINCPTEFVRNTDFVLDIVERYSGVDVTQKLVNFFSKISSVFKPTGDGK